MRPANPEEKDVRELDILFEEDAEKENDRASIQTQPECSKEEKFSSFEGKVQRCSSGNKYWFDLNLFRCSESQDNTLSWLCCVFLAIEQPIMMNPQKVK